MPPGAITSDRHQNDRGPAMLVLESRRPWRRLSSYIKALFIQQSRLADEAETLLNLSMK